jgi:hypothetical protein
MPAIIKGLRELLGQTYDRADRAETERDRYRKVLQDLLKRGEIARDETDLWIARVLEGHGIDPEAL